MTDTTKSQNERQTGLYVNGNISRTLTDHVRTASWSWGTEPSVASATEVVETGRRARS